MLQTIKYSIYRLDSSRITALYPCYAWMRTFAKPRRHAAAIMRAAIGVQIKYIKKLCPRVNAGYVQPVALRVICARRTRNSTNLTSYMFCSIK